MSNFLKKISQIFIKLNKWIHEKKNHFLEKELAKYREIYLKERNRLPNEVEEKHFKKNLIMKLGIIIYLPLTTILFILLQYSKGA